jgi:hypothetical protein
MLVHELNFLDNYFTFMYMHNNHCHRATAHLRLNIIIIIVINNGKRDVSAARKVLEAPIHSKTKFKELY